MSAGLLLGVLSLVLGAMGLYFQHLRLGSLRCLRPSSLIVRPIYTDGPGIVVPLALQNSGTWPVGFNRFSLRLLSRSRLADGDLQTGLQWFTLPDLTENCDPLPGKPLSIPSKGSLDLVVGFLTSSSWTFVAGHSEIVVLAHQEQRPRERVLCRFDIALSQEDLDRIKNGGAISLYQRWDGVEDNTNVLVSVAANSIKNTVIEPCGSSESRPKGLHESLVSQIENSFNTTGFFRGFFNRRPTPQEEARWQSDDGELVAEKDSPKFPYYKTFWACRGLIAASDGSLELVRVGDILKAIERSFAGKRWLHVFRKATFEEGPDPKDRISESVRHTVRAADITLLLAPQGTRVREIAWDLIREAPTLQLPSGGWVEFRNDAPVPGLWASVYIFAFLSRVLRDSDLGRVEEFRDKATPLLQKTESFLVDQWAATSWRHNTWVTWNEAACNVMSEVAEFLTCEELMQDIGDRLAALIEPSGRPIASLVSAEDRLAEITLAIRLAHALYLLRPWNKAINRQFTDLLNWIRGTVQPLKLEEYDAAFLLLILKGVEPRPLGAA